MQWIPSRYLMGSQGIRILQVLDHYQEGRFLRPHPKELRIKRLKKLYKEYSKNKKRKKISKLLWIPRKDKDRLLAIIIAFSWITCNSNSISKCRLNKWISLRIFRWTLILSVRTQTAIILLDRIRLSIFLRVPLGISQYKRCNEGNERER